MLIGLVGLVYHLSRLLTYTSELDHKREYVSNVMLQKIGPSVEDVSRAYITLNECNETDEPTDGPRGGLIENPLGSFETQSMELRLELERWVDWKKGVELCEDRVMWGLYSTVIGLILLIGSLLVGLLIDSYEWAGLVSALFAIAAILLLIISLYPVYSYSKLVRETNKTWRRVRDEQWGQKS